MEQTQAISNLKIRNASSWTMLIFGVLAFALGLAGLIRPEFTLSQLNLELVDRAQRASHDYTISFVLASSMASFNVGIYYVLASLHNLKKFYLWTVPFRCVTFTVFTLSAVFGVAPGAFYLVAVWELVGAVATGVALYYEKKHNIL